MLVVLKVVHHMSMKQDPRGRETSVLSGMIKVVQEIWIPFVMFFFLLSCSRERPGEATCVAKVNVDSCLSHPVSVFDYFSKVELIPLDSSFLISNGVRHLPSFFAMSEDRIYILDEMRLTIHVYDHHGKLISVVNHHGRGPGEFAIADGLRVNSFENTLDVLDPSGRIMRYCLDDSLTFHSMVNLHDTYKAVHSAIETEAGDYVLFSFTADKTLGLLRNSDGGMSFIDYKLPDWLYDFAATSPLFRIGNEVYYYEGYNGDVYSLDLDHHTKSLFLHWDAGRYQCLLKEIPPEKDVDFYAAFTKDYSDGNICRFSSMTASRDVLFTCALFKYDVCVLTYDFVTGEARLVTRTKEGVKLLPGCVSEGCMYSYVPYEMLEVYVNEDVVDSRSMQVMREAIQEEGAAILKYTLNGN